jgi:hypothetical protein
MMSTDPKQPHDKQPGPPTEKPDKPDKPEKPDNKVTFTVVVNGVPTEVEQNVHSPLSAVIERALQATNNVGQPPENWELRTDGGALLDASQKIETFGFVDGVTLFLSLRAGVGGGSGAERRRRAAVALQVALQVALKVVLPRR